MTEIYYLDMGDALSIHARQIEKYGSSEGVRDPGLVEAALYRPQGGYYRDIIEKAAALWESLTMNHGFIDGNKRVGFASCYVFLRMNGKRISANASEATAFVLASLESGTFTKDRLDEWLRANTEPV